MSRSVFRARARIENFRERAQAQILDRQPGQFLCLRSRHGAAVNCSQKIIQQTLAGGCIVEYFAHQSRLRGLLDEIPQALRRRIKTAEKERVDRRITRRQLRRMQIPALIKAARSANGECGARAIATPNVPRCDFPRLAPR